MNIEQILNEPRREVNPETIELPENMEVITPETNGNKTDTKENEDGKQVQMSLAELATMSVMLYNAIQTAIYKRVEPRFNAELTKEETQALIPTVKAVLQQYNVTMTPIMALLTTLAGINIAKIVQIKMLRAELQEEEKAKKAEQAKKQTIEIEEPEKQKEFANVN